MIDPNHTMKLHAQADERIAALNATIASLTAQLAAAEKDAALGRAIRSMDRLRLVGQASNYVCVELWN